jgi:hypothetical protein
MIRVNLSEFIGFCADAAVGASAPAAERRLLERRRFALAHVQKPVRIHRHNQFFKRATPWPW